MKEPVRFAYEARALRRLADALPGPGALTLLGAPLLAVVATFWLQPKASGSQEPGLTSAALSPAEADATNVQPLETPQSTQAAHETREPFRSIAQAIDGGKLDEARKLVQALGTNHAPAFDTDEAANDDSSETRLARLGEAYSVLLDCLEHPSNDTTARALHFYLEAAPEALRPRLHAACLAAPNSEHQ